MKEPKLIFTVEKRDDVNFYSLHAKFQNYLFPVKLSETMKKYSDMNDEELIRMAVNELKIEMAKDILNFKYKIEINK